jgi:hypothetical protein
VNGSRDNDAGLGQSGVDLVLLTLLAYELFAFTLEELTRAKAYKKPFCQPFVNFTIGRMALHSQGVKTLRVKPERPASIRLCRERCPVTSKDGKAVQDTARLCKEREVIFSEFAGVWQVQGLRQGARPVNTRAFVRTHLV